jgi:hypothetical protein
MKLLLSLTVCLFTLSVSQAQTSSTTSANQKPFNVSIRTMDNQKITGKLYDFDDNQVMLVTSSNESHAISAADIRTISFRQKNAVLKGALIGFTAGALTGIGCQRLLNLHYNDAPGKNNVKAGLIFGSGLALTGGLTAAAFKTTFLIRGKKARYYKLHSKLTKRLGR